MNKYIVCYQHHIRRYVFWGVDVTGDTKITSSHTSKHSYQQLPKQHWVCNLNVGWFHCWLVPNLVLVMESTGRGPFPHCTCSLYGWSLLNTEGQWRRFPYYQCCACSLGYAGGTVLMVPSMKGLQTIIDDSVECARKHKVTYKGSKSQFLYLLQIWVHISTNGFKISTRLFNTIHLDH